MIYFPFPIWRLFNMKGERGLNKDWLSHLWTFIGNVSSQMVAWPSPDYVLLLLANIVVQMKESNWQNISSFEYLLNATIDSMIEVRLYEVLWESAYKLICLKYFLSILQFLIHVYYCYHLTIYKITWYIIYWISALIYVACICAYFLNFLCFLTFKLQYN